MTKRQGVEIDRCPKGHGVWLDRGELDQIIESFMSAPVPTPKVGPSIPGHEADSRRTSNHGGHSGTKKSWLAQLFD
jgi:Zn-finger nucleic acid-binding protein